MEKLLKTVRRLRGDHGCPWDRKQTLTSLMKYIREESAELISAIENDDMENLCEEIGDNLYILIMLSEIARDKNLFSLQDVIDSIDGKLRFRHPHVFGDVKVSNEEELRQVWENAKIAEKKNKN